MLAVILKILSILGMILLILLGLVFFILLLVLFMPIVYRADADKSETALTANVRIRWLFGFLRADYHYPEPGKIIVKVLWKTVYDSGNPPTPKEAAASSSDNNPQPIEKEEEAKTPPTPENANQATSSENAAEAETKETHGEEIEAEDAPQSFSEKLFAKYEKIKYTIQQFCDKIKHIWDNIIFYKKLLQDEQTKLLLSHVFKRVGRILKHIRPRKLKADVIFGTGSPDTTGYAYGAYSMFLPQLGKNVFITPDFEQKIFVGTINAAGHITIFTLLVNVLAVLLDKRLRLLIRRLKNHKINQ